MAKITFTPNTETPGQPAGSQMPPAKDLAVVETAVTADEANLSKISRDDILLPRINLVQKSGKLCDDFAPGTFLFERQVVLAKPDEQFSAVVLGDKKYYQEKVEYGSTEFGKRAYSEQEVRDQGGTVTWGVADKPYYQSVADFLLAVKAPADITPDQTAMFPFVSPEGENYAVAIYTVAASAYTSLAKRIFTDKLYSLKDGLHLAEYRIKSELRRNSANSWYVPAVTMPKRYESADKAKFFGELKNL